MKREVVVEHPPRWYQDKGCRCEACVIQQNERVRRNRQERLDSGRLTHGKRSAYDAGCRCSDCTAARRAAYLRERATS